MWIGWCYRFILLGLIAMVLLELFRKHPIKTKIVAALVLVPLVLRFLMVA